MRNCGADIDFGVLCRGTCTVVAPRDFIVDGRYTVRIVYSNRWVSEIWEGSPLSVMVARGVCSAPVGG